MRTDELDYELPEASIAQTPVEPRDSARLLIDHGPGELPVDAVVSDLPDLLEPGDLLVLNETRVLPARIAVRRPSGAMAEVLLLEPFGEDHPQWWQALCRPSRKLRAGDVVSSVEGELRIEVGDELQGGRRLVRPMVDGDLLEVLDRAGTAPLPPYIHERLEDQERYQTVYSKRAASAAAPTAGLHLTESVLERARGRGVEIATVELVVGLDTFRPISTDTVESHRIHSEQYRVSPEAWQTTQRIRRAGGRVVAVGTTTVRALESAEVTGELQGRTRLFILPGHHFAVVDLMLTNFHLPRSSLLAMIEAFVGPRWRELYGAALERDYRFLSFGDASLLRHAGSPTS